jgi:hypothetical protein
VVLISKPTVTVSLAQGKAKFSELLAVRIQGVRRDLCGGRAGRANMPALPQVIPVEASPHAWIFNPATGTRNQAVKAHRCRKPFTRK